MNEESTKEIILQDKEVQEVLDNNLQNVKNESEINKENLQDDSLKEEVQEKEVEVFTQTILVDGQPKDFYVEMYREIRISNFLLQLILIVIPVLYCCNKIYSAIRSALTVRF